MPISLLSLPLPTTHWPVWRDSVSTPVSFAPMPKKAATRLWHRARDFDRQTRRKGRHDGEIGHASMQVLHALVFDFLNFRTGRLDPSYAAIARKANVCERTVAAALQRLKRLGILAWVRRCAESVRDGRYIREQQTNAYQIQTEAQWLGYRPPPPPPAPTAGTWGDPAPMATPAGDLSATATFLGAETGNPLSAALARFARTMATRASGEPENLGFPRTA
jgi:hypothetical protein